MHLEIYVTQHCLNCAEALVLAELVRNIDGVEVAVIDLEQPGQSVPSRVIAVPTYILDGNVISLGNPEREAFLAHLHQSCQECVS